jgi:hypothetical protein
MWSVAASEPRFQAVIRLFIEIFHERVRGRAVQVVVILFDVLAVVTFTVRKAKETLLQDGVVAIPESQAEAQALLVVGITCDAIFTPVIRARTGLVMREIVPDGALVAVVFADGAPLAFGRRPLQTTKPRPHP